MCIKLLTPVLPVTVHDQTSIGLTYTQVLQQEKIFPMILRSELLGQLSVKYVRKCLICNHAFFFFSQQGQREKNEHLTQLLASAHSPESELLFDWS